MRPINRQIPGIIQIQHRILKLSTEVTLVKRENVFIQKVGENYETPTDSVVASSVLFILARNPFDVQSMTIQSRQINTLIYYRWNLGAYDILDHQISVDVLGMLEYTQKTLLQSKPDKDDDILTGQYMELGEEINLYLVSVDNTATARDVIYLLSVP